MMDTFFQVLAVIIGPLAGILVYMLIEGKRKAKAKTKAKSANEAETMLDDTSYIQDMKHLSLTVKSVLWQQV